MAVGTSRQQTLESAAPAAVYSSWAAEKKIAFIFTQYLVEGEIKTGGKTRAARWLMESFARFKYKFFLSLGGYNIIEEKGGILGAQFTNGFLILDRTTLAKSSGVDGGIRAMKIP